MVVGITLTYPSPLLSILLHPVLQLCFRVELFGSSPDGMIKGPLNAKQFGIEKESGIPAGSPFSEMYFM